MDLLLNAAQRGYLDEIKKEIGGKSFPDAKDDLGNNLIHLAAGSGRLEVLQYLLSVKGSESNLNAKNHIGDTPLHKAAFRGYEEVVKFLLSKGSDPKAINSQNQTPRDVSREDEARDLFPAPSKKEEKGEVEEEEVDTKMGKDDE
eukprot:TRINITY_DN4897_c0_g1_i1.p1 TRINITY_DN4897_c0_g1~~TRINITY_DN4897_c0_g1_i1.p1  ORF type:complete len:145 (+),score=77.15 TRINITY_DN4897_c0_g1_i1:144-578(+)